TILHPDAPGRACDHSRPPLVAGYEWQPDRRWIHAAAEIGVDKIDPAGVVPDLDLAGTWRRHRNVLVGQHVRTARLVYSHRCDHYCHSLLDLHAPRTGPAAAMSLSGACGSSRHVRGGGRRLRFAMTLNASTAPANAMAK